MNARRRYEFAFLALGWLLLGAILLHGRGAALRSFLERATDSASRVGQKFSDEEGAAVQKVRGSSRRDEVAKELATFRSAESLRHPDRILYGVYDGLLPSSFAGVEELEGSLDYRFPILSSYVAWGDKPDQQFPSRFVETVDRLGSIPMITWEPWVTAFDEQLRKNLPPVKEREYASLAAIARGDYDFYIVPFATEAAKYGKPLFLRFGHEMNDPYRYPWGPQNGNRPDDFIAAWRHVHVIFQKMNASNVLWVWSPHISMPWFEYYYPGDEWVDWIGTGILNYGDTAPWSRWWSFHQILEKAYPALQRINKPIMISEFGTLTSGGDAVQWYDQAVRDMAEKYQRIRCVVLFNQKYDVTLSNQPLNWSVLQSPRVTNAVRAALHRKQSPAVTTAAANGAP
jgi:hypothetical protein